MNRVNNVRWNNLKMFSVRIASRSDQLYANGRQQLYLRIDVEGMDVNGNSVKLSPEEISSLRLVNHRGGDIPFSRSKQVAPLQNRDAWDWSYDLDTQYEYHPAISRPESSNEEFSAFVEGIDTYVRCIADNPLRVAARITRSDGEVFYSSNLADGSVNVFPARVPRYRAMDYTFDAIDVARRNEIQIDYIAFALHAGGESIRFTDFSMSPASILQEAGQFRRAPYNSRSQVKSIAFTGYTKPGQPSITYASGVTGPRPPSIFIGSDQMWRAIATGMPVILPTYVDASFIRPGRPVVVAIRSWTTRSNLPGRTRSARIHAVDMYGNSHDVNVRLVEPGGSFQQLELFD